MCELQCRKKANRFDLGFDPFALSFNTNRRVGLLRVGEEQFESLTFHLAYLALFQG